MLVSLNGTALTAGTSILKEHQSLLHTAAVIGNELFSEQQSSKALLLSYQPPKDTMASAIFILDKAVRHNVVLHK